MASFFLTSDNSRSRRRRSSSSAPSRLGRSSSGALSSAAAAFATCTSALACLRAAMPVSASMRRTPAATPLSATTEMTPMSPVRRTCVPPQSSTDQPMVFAAVASRPSTTTRTSSPYFSPNSARAPEAMASSSAISRVVTGAFCSTTALAMSSTALDLGGAHRLVVREVEAQPIGRHQRTLLRHVIAEHLAQRLVQEMGRGMVAREWPRGARDRRRDAAASPTFERPCLAPAHCARRGHRPSSACRDDADAHAPSATGHRRRCRRPGRRIRRRTGSG